VVGMALGSEVGTWVGTGEGALVGYALHAFMRGWSEYLPDGQL
jgi:hypothetical protein